MKSQDHVDAVQHAGVEHGLPTTGLPERDLFGRLKHERHPSLPACMRGERLRDTHQHGRVDVMPAGVSNARGRGRVGHGLEVLGRQCVHVGPNQDMGVRSGTVQVCHYTRLGLPSEDGKAGGGKSLCDAVGGADLVEPQLRMTVQVPPKGDEGTILRRGQLDHKDVLY